MNKILVFCEKVIAVVGCLIFAVLSYYSFRYTLLKQYNSTMLENRDNLPVHFLAVAVMLVISCVLYRISHEISAKAVHVMAVLLSGLVFFVCIAIYMSAEFLPIVDQGHVYMNAVAIADKEVGHIIEPEYYILYSFQIGLTELMALAMKLTGNTTVGMLDVGNSVFTTISVCHVYIWGKSGNLCHYVCVLIFPAGKQEKNVDLKVSMVLRSNDIMYGCCIPCQGCYDDSMHCNVDTADYVLSETEKILSFAPSTYAFPGSYYDGKRNDSLSRETIAV